MTDYSVSRLTYVWLLLTQTCLLAPHAFRFAAVIIPLWLFCIFWRSMIFFGRWGYPGKTIKTSVVALTSVMILYSQPNWMSIEFMVLTLLSAFLLKLIEMKNKRDVLIAIYLAYFVIVTQLIFDQTILSGMFLVLGLLLVTATLVSFHANDDEVGFFYPLKDASKIIAFSLPLMVVGFLVFPRLDPLWMVPMPSQSGKTGVSGTMTPGDFADLIKKDELAFRVEFSGAIPEIKDMYWRGLVLTDFDGRTWRPHEYREFFSIQKNYQLNTEAVTYEYTQIVEPSFQEWMFPLDGVIETDAKIIFYDDLTIKHPTLIDSRQSWTFKSQPDAAFQVALLPQYQKENLQLPTGFNPKTKAFAQKLYSESLNEHDFIRRVMQYYRDEQFYYTLQPPLLGRHSVDDFLFKTRRGFCEHYASSFTVLMREVGIPARVIAGYHGGDRNPYESHVTVKQLDAHAWVEVWLEGEGWVRMDPTYAVAPDRIENGSELSLREQPGFLEDAPISISKFTEYSWVKKLQHRFDQMNYLWHQWVLSFSGDKQNATLEKLLGSTSIKTIAYFVGGCFIGFSFLIWLYMFLKSRPKKMAKAEKLYRRFLLKLKRKGIRKKPGEGVNRFNDRAVKAFPASADKINAITRQYEALSYAKIDEEKEKARLLKQFKRDVMQLKVRK